MRYQPLFTIISLLCLHASSVLAASGKGALPQSIAQPKNKKDIIKGSSPNDPNSRRQLQSSKSTRTGGGVNSNTNGCIYTAWLRECNNGGFLFWADNVDEFKDGMTDFGDDGFHLVAADYDAVAGTYMGFFEDLPGEYWWFTTADRDEFVDNMDDAFDDGYDATALFHANGVYFAWLRYNPGVTSGYFGTFNNDNFHDELNERRSDGFLMSAALNNGQGYWFGWFYKPVPNVPSLWSQTYSISSLYDDYNDKIDDYYYATVSMHGDCAGECNDGTWITWYEQDTNGGITWWAQEDVNDIWNWIVEEVNEEGKCLTALTHGCDY